MICGGSLLAFGPDTEGGSAGTGSRPVPASDEKIAEVRRRLAAFHSPSFDREIVEALLARIDVLLDQIHQTNDEQHPKDDRHRNLLPD